MFRFALVSTDGDSLGPVAFARGDWKPGDIIPQGRGRMLRVTAVIDPEPDDPPDRMTLLVVEAANLRSGPEKEDGPRAGEPSSLRHQRVHGQDQFP